MNTRLLLLAAAPLLCATAHAQWRTETYTLRGGWNSIYLAGDAQYATLAALLPQADIEEVWRWNPNPNQLQFTSAPSLPLPGTPEWTRWARGDADTMRLTGQTAYLIKCADAAPQFTVTIKQSPVPPAGDWVRAGANFMGFPTFKNGADYPAFTDYFATFPAAIASNAKIYRYIGGELGPANPLQVFSPALERLDATQAYWFSAPVVGDFYAQLDVQTTTPNGLDFGRTGSEIIVTIYNRSGQAVNLFLSAVASEPAPVGADSLADGTNDVGLPTGSVPLTQRLFNTATAAWEETLITNPLTRTVAQRSSREFSFGIQRTAMTGTAGAHYGSLLRIRDTGNLMDILLPVRARKTSLSGLWIGDALVNAVESKPAADAVTPAARTYPLRYIVHVADDGTARVLSQVFMGKLTGAGNPVGLCTKESGLLAADKVNARRISAVHLPLDRIIDGTAGTGTGSVGIGSTLTRKISLPFDDKVNPFVHQYHPDHDNKSPRGDALVAGQESHTIERNVTFTFTAAPPGGGPVPAGWGATILGGTYGEVINGLHKDSAGTGTGDGLRVTGTFELRRASELGTLTITP